MQSGIWIALSQYVTEVSSADVLILSDLYSFLDSKVINHRRVDFLILVCQNGYALDGTPDVT